MYRFQSTWHCSFFSRTGCAPLRVSPCAAASMSAFPSFQLRDPPCCQPREKAVDAIRAHFPNAILLHLPGGVNLGWSQKFPVFITHRTVLRTQRAVPFGTSSFFISLQRESTALANLIGFHGDRCWLMINNKPSGTEKLQQYSYSSMGS